MSKRAAAWLLPMAATVVAQPAAGQRLSIDLPAGTLGAAVDALVHQTGISVVLSDPALWARRVPSVKGRVTVETAVQSLARHAHARADRLGRGGWRLTIAPRPRTPARPQPPASRPILTAPLPDEDVVVLASKRGTTARQFAGSVELIDARPVGSEAGTETLVTRSTIISSTYRGAGREKLFIRGLADSAFSGRLQSVTGLYFGDVRLTYSASDPDLQLYDMASVEVLQGPQGTLYGSGSLAGIIRLDPVPPKQGKTEAMIGGGVSAVAQGSRGADLNATINLPLSGNLSVRAVGYVRAEPGYIDKPALGRDVNATRIDGARAIVRWWPRAGWTVDVIGMVQATRSRDAQYATIDAPPLVQTGTLAEPFGSDYAAGHIVSRGRIGDLDLVSATGWSAQHFYERFGSDLFGSERIADVRRRHAMFSQETRLSRRGAGDTGWVVGAFYTRAKGMSAYGQTLGERNVGLLDIDDRVTETALFGEATVGITPFLSLGAGARLGRATTEVRFSSPLGTSRPSPRREQWLLPTASVLLHPTHRLSAYVRYQQGARPGVAQPGLQGATDAAGGERVATFDIGLRWEQEGGWHASASVERSRWRHLRLDFFESFFGFIGGTLGDWRVASVHAALGGPVLPGLRVNAAATINQNGLIAQQPLPVDLHLPDIAGVIARSEATWTHRLGETATLRLNGWVRYEGASYGFFPLFLPKRQGDYVRTGILADLDRGPDRVSLSVDNLLNTQGDRYVFGTTARVDVTTTPLQPRTVRIGYRRLF